MKKHALAVALLGIAMGCAGQAAVNAGPSLSSVAAPIRITDPVVMKVGGVCLTEIPIVVMFLVFYELTRDKEYDCNRRYNRDNYGWQPYEEPQYPSYKDAPYVPPEHLREPR